MNLAVVVSLGFNLYFNVHVLKWLVAILILCIKVSTEVVPLYQLIV